jgi:hypothetical protein
MSPRIEATPPARGRLFRPTGGGDDDGIAMLLTMIAILTASGLSLLILGTVVAGRTPTILNRKNVRTVHAAEAGIDIALARIRASQMQDPANPLDPSKTVGDRRKLPCAIGLKYGTMQGALQGSPGQLTYAVTVRYFSDNPAGQTDAWRVTNSLNCAATGLGPVITPRYALLAATGGGAGVPGLAVTAGDRAMETIYDFVLTNTNVSGGLIHNYYDGAADTRDLCFDAGSGSPVAGTQLRVQACLPGAESQLWAWQKNFTIGLASTQTTMLSGMCVTLDVPGFGTAYVTLQPCDGLPHQQWGYNDGAHFQARPLYPGNSTAYCPVIETDNTPNSKVIGTTGACGGGGGARNSTWRPEAKVGAGSVGDVGNNVVEKPMQWVNFAEFGRCFDVSNWTVGYVNMIAYPCKQDPTAYVGWNQTMAWTAGTNNWLYTYGWNSGKTYAEAKANNPGGRVCLTTVTSSGGYVTMRACVSGAANQSWIVNRDIPDPAKAYTVVDGNGRCLSIGPPNLTQGDNGIKQWSSIIAEDCDGSPQQKWNAPPNTGTATTHDTRELGS